MSDWLNLDNLTGLFFNCAAYRTFIDRKTVDNELKRIRQ